MFDVEAALIRCVIEKPEDDGQRLVLADWWEENGNPDRAEFCRVQIELANDPKRADCRCGACEEGNGVVCFVRQRERALLDKHWSVWSRESLPEVYCVTTSGNGCEFAAFSAPNTPIFKFTFTRGFVGRVSLTLAAFVGGLCRRYGTCGLYNGGPHPCSDCRGTGTMPGLAAALAGACPLEEVVLTDREPHRSSPMAYWWNVGGGLEHTYELTRELFDRLEEFDHRWTGQPTENDGKAWINLADARVALTRACRAFARSRVPWLAASVVV